MPRLWSYGPVFPKVHKKYSEIAKSENDKITSVKNPEIVQILEKTVEKWGNVSSGALSACSNSEVSPWDIMVDRGEKWNSVMPLIAIKMYFGRMVENVLMYYHNMYNKKYINPSNIYEQFSSPILADIYSATLEMQDDALKNDIFMNKLIRQKEEQ